MKKLTIAIFGGGTIIPIRPHMALCAPAFGETARQLATLFTGMGHTTKLHLTKMADHTSTIVTNDDLASVVRNVVEDTSTNVIIMNSAVTDFYGTVVGYQDSRARLKTRNKDGIKAHYTMDLFPTEKIVSRIRHGDNGRKDVFLVSTKTTALHHLSYDGTGMDSDSAKAIGQEMYLTGLKLLKESSSNIVLVNDIYHRFNMIVVPEEAHYCFTENRSEVLKALVTMIQTRANLHFTKSKVIPSPLVAWQSDEVPSTLRTVVDFCIKEGAYKPFLGKTAGHFAAKLKDGEFLTSPRKKDFNNLSNIGMVRVVTNGPDDVIAYGAKPSVGGQSQRAVFASHPDLDSIVHFHSEKKAGSNVPVRSQFEFECGSHECGENTASGLKEMRPNIYAVHLDNHGPNIVFNSKTVSAGEVIDFITENWELKQKSGGFQLRNEKVAVYS